MYYIKFTYNSYYKQ